MADENQSHIGKEQRADVIGQLAALLAENYVFPEKGEAMSRHLRERLAAGAYDLLDDAEGLAAVLNAELDEICRDHHLRVAYDPSRMRLLDSVQEDQEKVRQHWAETSRFNNFGFIKVERLIGNIGYLDLREFAPPDMAGEVAVAAMNFLVNTLALILDLRRNGGGSPHMIQLITTYLFDGEPQHINSFFWRPSGANPQFWTLPYVPGPRMADKDVFVLTSAATFSAGEEFCYNLKNMGRATLVGERTRGGAHPVDMRSLPEGFIVHIPVGRAINPITGANWEGTGVPPDIEVPAEEALTAAHRLALERLIEKTESEELRKMPRWDLQTLEAQVNPVKIEAKTLRAYAGSYGDRRIVYRDGRLFSERNGLWPLTPLNENTFVLNEEQRLQFVSGGDGKVSTLVSMMREGNRSSAQRDE